MALGSRSARPTADGVLPTRTEAAVTAGDRLTTSVSRSPARGAFAAGGKRHIEGKGGDIKLSVIRWLTTASDGIALPGGRSGSAIVGIKELRIPKVGLSPSDICLPGHFYIERLAVTIGTRIDPPIDGLSNIGKQAG